MAVHDYRTMTEAVKGLQDRGFPGNFEVIDGLVHDVGSGQTFLAHELTIVEHHRFEGISDPDDSSVCYALKARDGTRGILVDAYGTYADPDVSEFLTHVPIHEKN
ncbi:MAG: phosphoribosylpyrophosphate synthetase [Nitrospiraceae bacterium]|nr:MAG: phosphoribosylpyrophosphate synthetase [Nitrospiraceae bacterium]